MHVANPAVCCDLRNLCTGLRQQDANMQYNDYMQALVLFKELAAVVDAETGSAMSDYILLKDMNQVSEIKYAGMVQQVEALQPALQVMSCA